MERLANAKLIFTKLKDLVNIGSDLLRNDVIIGHIFSWRLLSGSLIVYIWTIPFFFDFPSKVLDNFFPINTMKTKNISN